MSGGSWPSAPRIVQICARCVLPCYFLARRENLGPTGRLNLKPIEIKRVFAPDMSLVLTNGFPDSSKPLFSKLIANIPTLLPIATSMLADMPMSSPTPLMNKGDR